ncbi:MAG TPA: serine hydrolase domain-containing protein [Dehalococcoidia bacterium]|nr:serine hydrolase domain-containing protein [Dehalococcoidia bacterium]
MIASRFLASTPENAGIDSEKLEAVFARVKRDVDAGLVPSAQVAVARHGKIAGLRTFGEATDETLYCIFSCTKAVVAAAVWLLLEDGLLKLDERVADIIPEFATNGKDVVTVEQVLLHTGGFPLAPFRAEHWESRDKLLEAFARWRLNWKPGTRYEYHATSAHWVLAEIIYRRTGRDFRDVIRERVTGPMGLDELFVGLPDEYEARAAEVGFFGEMIPPPGGWGEVTPDAILTFNRPFGRRSGVPGGGGVTGAGELAMFYQTLINGGETHEGKRILKRETIDFATTVRNNLPDPVFAIPANRGLSIIVAGDDGNAFARGFGRVASPRAIGHGGAGGQIAWGDPDTGISVGYCTNGFNDWMTVGRRITAIGSLAAGCAI